MAPYSPEVVPCPVLSSPGYAAIAPPYRHRISACYSSRQPYEQGTPGVKPQVEGATVHEPVSRFLPHCMSTHPRHAVVTALTGRVENRTALHPSGLLGRLRRREGIHSPVGAQEETRWEVTQRTEISQYWHENCPLLLDKAKERASRTPAQQ